MSMTAHVLTAPPSSQLMYKNLIALEALQALRPETLLEFLRPYETWCAGIGVTLDRPLDDASLRRLHRALWSEDVPRPEALCVALIDLGDMAGFWGWEATVHAAIEEWREGRLDPAKNPVELAFREYLTRHTELFAAIAQRVHGRGVQRLVEFAASNATPLTMHRDSGLRHRFESDLGRWFDARGRTSYCQVGVDESSNEIQFRVVRGTIPRSQQTIVDQSRVQRIDFVPARPDLLVFDKRTCMLAVNAQLAHEHDCYRRMFGRVYFEDEDHFRVEEIYSGAPLFRDCAHALSAEGFPAISAVVLREVRLDARKPKRIRATFLGDDIGDALDSLVGGGIFASADVRFVKLAIHLRHRTKPTLVEIIPPNRCKLDRRFGADLVRELLLARGFLRVPTLEPREPVVAAAAE